MNKEEIYQKTRYFWNSKSGIERYKVSRKYKHIKSNSPQTLDWTLDFDKLTRFQRNILMKGELIRTYDSLPNQEKTNIKKHFGLSEFSSKWYLMNSEDKKILMKHLVF